MWWFPMKQHLYNPQLPGMEFFRRSREVTGGSRRAQRIEIDPSKVEETNHLQKRKPFKVRLLRKTATCLFAPKCRSLLVRQFCLFFCLTGSSGERLRENHTPSVRSCCFNVKGLTKEPALPFPLLQRGWQWGHSFLLREAPPSSEQRWAEALRGTRLERSVTRLGFCIAPPEALSQQIWKEKPSCEELLDWRSKHYEASKS